MKLTAGFSILLAFLLASCGDSAPVAQPASTQPVSQSTSVIEIPVDSPKLAQIRVAPVQLAELPTDEFTAPGKIVVNPNRVSKVLLPVSGRITEVLVRFGDAVKKDQPLLTIESPDAETAASDYLQAEGNVAQANAGLHKAQADLERVQELFKGDAIAKKEVVAAETTAAQVKSTLQQAHATLQQAKARLELLGLKPGAFRQKIAVRAPLSGKITEMTVVAGEFRNDLSSPLVTIADLSTVWISADVPESSIRLVKIGERFEVRLSAFPGEVFHSGVTRVADGVDPQTRTVEVWAELANPQGQLRPEMFGEVRHIESYHKVSAVPSTAVIQAQRRTIVYREIAKGKFQQTEVEVGKRSGDLMPVLKGLAPSDRVVVDGAMLLRGY